MKNNSTPRTDPIARQVDTLQASLRYVFVSPMDFGPKQIRIIELVTQGLQDKEIADRMCLSISGVKWYLRAIYAQLNLHRPHGYKRRGLMIWAKGEGLWRSKKKA